MRGVALYFAGVGAVLLIASSGVGDGLPAIGLVRRNSEGYAMALLVPLFWELVVTSGSRVLVGWFTGIATAVVAAQPPFGLDLPNGFVTLQEAFVAALVVSVYVVFVHQDDGAPSAADGDATAVPVWSRSVYYALVVGLLLLVYRRWTRVFFGDPAVDWLQRNDEAFAAVILVPLYFDAVRWRSRARSVGWIIAMTAMPLAVQSGVFGSIDDDPVTGWLERVTEAFVAAALIAIYFEWVRRRPPGASRSPLPHDDSDHQGHQPAQERDSARVHRYP